jgi:Domain of unknown function (DUF4129)
MKLTGRNIGHELSLSSRVPLSRRQKCVMTALALVLLTSATALAVPLNNYHQRIKQAVTALNTLSQPDESEPHTNFTLREVATVQAVRNLLPQTESVEVDGSLITVDNAWLHQEFDKFAPLETERHGELRQTITERLAAIDERIDRLEQTAVQHSDGKTANRNRMEEILKRSEYAHKAQQENALTRVVLRFLRWLRDWFPKPKPMSPGGAGIVTQIAKWLVIILALALLAFVLKTFLPRFLSDRNRGKKRKAEARIVMGERLEPDQSARDLLAEAEALARKGELRAAIRRAYIALLVELGDRKIISLAQHNTNRDYLRAMRELEPLYANVKQLTDSFELHWYGLEQADETDWRAFRAAYDQALKT